MKIAVIGNGAMTGYVAQHAGSNYSVDALILKRDRAKEFTGSQLAISSVKALPETISLVVDCAGHEALRNFGPEVLRSGRDLVTVSVGALADKAFFDTLQTAARSGNSTLHLCSGAIGSLDCLQAATAGSLKSVTYIGRKPPKGWIGSPAENKLNLKALTTPAAHFTGTARAAALAYPKNANVAAAVALAGIGMDDTQVELIADPTISANIHEVKASGDFGQFTFRIDGETLPDNPRTSALAAMSVVSKINSLGAAIRF